MDLFWVVVLSLGSAGERTIADLRRSYERVTGEDVSASSFYNRLTPDFSRFLRAVLAQGLESSAVAPKAQRRFSARFVMSSASTPL